MVQATVAGINLAIFLQSFAMLLRPERTKNQPQDSDSQVDDEDGRYVSLYVCGTKHWEKQAEKGQRRCSSCIPIIMPGTTRSCRRRIVDMKTKRTCSEWPNRPKKRQNQRLTTSDLTRGWSQKHGKQRNSSSTDYWLAFQSLLLLSFLSFLSSSGRHHPRSCTSNHLTCLFSPFFSDPATQFVHSFGCNFLVPPNQSILPNILLM